MENLSRMEVRRSQKQLLGVAMKQERLRRNLNFMEVSQATRIPIYVLVRIEQGKICYIWECYKLAVFYGKRLKAELVWKNVIGINSLTIGIGCVMYILAHRTSLSFVLFYLLILFPICEKSLFQKIYNGWGFPASRLSVITNEFSYLYGSKK